MNCRMLAIYYIRFATLRHSHGLEQLSTVLMLSLDDERYVRYMLT